MRLSEKNLFKHFSEVLHSPLPFSKSALQKDRFDGRLSIPFSPIGGRVFYDVEVVLGWLEGLPVVIPTRSTQAQANKPKAARRGKPSKTETMAASRLGITVPELRAKGGV